MTWPELSALISRSVLQFPDPPLLELPVTPLLPTTFLQEERRTHAIVDATVRRFSRDKDWPEMTPVERYFVAQRLHFVSPFLKLLAFSKRGEADQIFPNSPPEIADETQIEWLLNEAWAAVGVFEWERRVNEELGKEIYGQ